MEEGSPPPLKDNERQMSSQREAMYNNERIPVANPNVFANPRSYHPSFHDEHIHGGPYHRHQNPSFHHDHRVPVQLPPPMEQFVTRDQIGYYREQYDPLYSHQIYQRSSTVYPPSTMRMPNDYYSSPPPIYDRYPGASHHERFRPPYEHYAATNSQRYPPCVSCEYRENALYHPKEISSPHKEPLTFIEASPHYHRHLPEMTNTTLNKQAPNHRHLTEETISQQDASAGIRDDIKSLSSQMSDITKSFSQFMNTMESKVQKLEEKLTDIQNSQSNPSSVISDDLNSEDEVVGNFESATAVSTRMEVPIKEEKQSPVVIQSDYMEALPSSYEMLKKSYIEVAGIEKQKNEEIHDAHFYGNHNYDENPLNFQGKQVRRNGDVNTPQNTKQITTGAKPKDSNNCMLYKEEVSTTNSRRFNERNSVERIYEEPLNYQLAEQREGELIHHGLNTIKEFAKDYLLHQPPSATNQENLSLFANDVARFLQTPTFTNDVEEVKEFTCNTNRKSLLSGLCRTALDLGEHALKKKLDDCKGTAALEALKGFVESVFTEGKEKAAFHNFFNDYLPIFAKKNEGLDFVNTVIQNLLENVDKKSPNEIILDAYETTITHPGTLPLGNYRDYCSSIRITELLESEGKQNDQEILQEIITNNEEPNVGDNDFLDDLDGFDADEEVNSEGTFHSLQNMEILEDVQPKDIEDSKYGRSISFDTHLDMLMDLSDSLKNTQCRRIALCLGSPLERINDIFHEKQDSHRDARLNVFKMLIERLGKSFTENILIQKLRAVNRTDLVQKYFPDYFKHNPCLMNEHLHTRTLSSKINFTSLLERAQLYLEAVYMHIPLPVAPWLNKTLSLDQLFVDSKMILKNSSGFENKGKEIKLEELFMIVNRQYPNRILIEGPPGYGKSTLTLKLGLDWAKKEPYMNRFCLVFIVPLRYFDENLEQILIDEFALEGVSDQDKLAVIAYFERNILLILDGYDELSDAGKASLTPLLKGEKYSKMTILLTSRTGLFKLPKCKKQMGQNKKPTGGIVRMNSLQENSVSFWKKRIEIRGISPEKRKDFLQNYLKIDAEDLYSKLGHVMKDEMANLYECPLVLLLLAMLVEDRGAENITSKTDLYEHVVNFIVRRSLVKESLIPEEEEVNLFETSRREMKYFPLLHQFSEYCMKKLASNTLMFKEIDILNNCNNDKTVLKLGFLTKNIKISRHENEEFYEPVHKTFLEFLAAFWLWKLYKNSLNPTEDFQREINSLLKANILNQKDSLFFTFLTGLLKERTHVLLEMLYPWSYSLSVEEFPISNIIKESPFVFNLVRYLNPFIPPIFQVNNAHLTSPIRRQIMHSGLQLKKIKVLNIDVYNLTKIPCIDIPVDIVQLDIWGKVAAKNLPSIKQISKMITCKSLVCWFYGTTEENWNHSASVIRCIKAQHVNVIINAYDDYTQLPLILKKIGDELKYGQWQNINISFLKVLGLDGKNDLQSLPLITDLVKSGKITEGLAIVIKSHMGSLETLSFWFNTRFLKMLKAIIHSYVKRLQSVSAFKKGLTKEAEEIVIKINEHIKNLSINFDMTLTKLKRKFSDNCGHSSDSDSEKEMIKGAYKRGNSEDKSRYFALDLQNNCLRILNDTQLLYKSFEKDEAFLFAFADEFQFLVDGFCNYLNSYDDRLEVKDDEAKFEDRDSDKMDLNVGVKWLRHAMYTLTPFKRQLDLLLDAVAESKLVNFTLNNSYQNTMKTPCLNGRVFFVQRKWNILHLGNKIGINKLEDITNVHVSNFGLAYGRKRRTETDFETLIKCTELTSLTASTALLKALSKKEEWSGFRTLKALNWHLEVDNFQEDESNLLEIFKKLELLRLNFESVAETFNFTDFPHLPFSSLKILEIYEVDFENIDFVKAMTNSLMDLTAQNPLKELRLDLSKEFETEDLRDIYLTARDLLLEKNNNITKVVIIDPSETQTTIIMNLFSFQNGLKLTTEIEGFEDWGYLFYKQETKSSSDIRFQLAVSRIEEE